MLEESIRRPADPVGIAVSPEHLRRVIEALRVSPAEPEAPRCFHCRWPLVAGACVRCDR